jgi:hypothetical protein
LAGVIGAASLVQPELMPGEVAVIGTMAKTAAQKGVISIAQTEGVKVVQAVAKDVKKPDATEEKNANANVKDAKSDEKDPKPNETNEKTTAPTTETTPNANGDKTISIEVAQPQDATKAAGELPDKKDEAEPVSLEITIGANGEVKAVKKAVKEEPKAPEPTPAAAPDAVPPKTKAPTKDIPVVGAIPSSQPETISAPKESSEIEPSETGAKAPAPEPAIEEVKAKTPALKEEAAALTSELTTKQPEIQTPTPLVNGVQSTPAAVAIPEPSSLLGTPQQVPSSRIEVPIIATSTIATATAVSSTITEAPKPTIEAASVPMVTIPQASLDALHHSMACFPPPARL